MPKHLSTLSPKSHVHVISSIVTWTNIDKLPRVVKSKEADLGIPRRWNCK